MPAWVQKLKAELADPKKRLAVGGLAGGAVLLGVRSRKKATSGGGAGSGTVAGVTTQAANMVPVGATSDTIPGGYNGSGTDGLQSALNALTTATGQITTLTEQLRDGANPPTTTTPATPTPAAPPAPATPTTGLASLRARNQAARGESTIDTFRRLAATSAPVPVIATRVPANR